MTANDKHQQSEDKLYSSPADALKKVTEAYDYWTGRLTDVSLQMCYALIGANWVVFGSLNGILDRPWAKASMLMVILALAANIYAAWYLSEALRDRVKYGESDRQRWRREYDEFSESSTAWPFTDSIDVTARNLRMVKFTFPLLAGACLIIGGILK